MTITFKDLATLPIPDLLQRMLDGEEIEYNGPGDKYSWERPCSSDYERMVLCNPLNPEERENMESNPREDFWSWETPKFVAGTFTREPWR